MDLTFHYISKPISAPIFTPIHIFLLHGRRRISLPPFISIPTGLLLFSLAPARLFDKNSEVVAKPMTELMLYGASVGMQAARKTKNAINFEGKKFLWEREFFFIFALRRNKSFPEQYSPSLINDELQFT